MGSNCLWKCFLREVIACGNYFMREVIAWERVRGLRNLFDPNYLLEPPVLAGCNMDQSDQKSAANIYKSVHITYIPETKK